MAFGDAEHDADDASDNEPLACNVDIGIDSTITPSIVFFFALAVAAVLVDKFVDCNFSDEVAAKNSDSITS